MNEDQSQGNQSTQENQDTQNNQELSKGERHRLKKQRRQAEKEAQRQARLQSQRKKSTKKALITALIIGVVLVGGYWYFSNIEFKEIDESEIITRSGIHWHPDLSIYINGEPQTIPANLGLTGRRHASMHTHDITGKLHLETNGIIRYSDVTVKAFFEIWGQEFNAQCIFEFCNGEDGQVRMLVNGQANFEFENYEMRDNDRIEIRFE